MIKATNLTNIRIGADGNYRASIRFKAHFTAPIAAFRSYWILENPHPGYAHGWRGQYKFQLCQDNAGLPGAVIAEGARTPDPAYTEYPNNGAFPLVLFDYNSSVKAGQWYHIVISNIDPDQLNNYASLDVLMHPTLINQIPDMQVLVETNGVWAVVQADIASPIGIFYADANVQGCSYYQVAADGSLMSAEAYGFPTSLKL